MRKHISRKAQAPRLTKLAALMATSSLAGLLALPALAQTAAPAAPAADVGGLDRVVITATSTLKSKLRSSVSVTDIDQEQVRDLGVRSEAEVLLLIPGIRAEPTAGPGGNSNISVRGLPISSGGSKYVQLQEDGLPTVQFGDMNFGNNDYWTRFDRSRVAPRCRRSGSSCSTRGCTRRLVSSCATAWRMPTIGGPSSSTRRCPTGCLT
jgi:outer membrane receptor protein involved in Fe transport